MTIRHKVSNDTDVIYVRGEGRRLADTVGFSKADQTRIAIAVSELATNIVKYAGSGEISFDVEDDCLVVEARDEGPGIKSIENAFRDNWSDSKCLLDDDFIKHVGMGTGLPAVVRMMDDVQVVETSSEGTVIRAVKRVDGNRSG